jgi:hypothetical protein
VLQKNDLILLLSKMQEDGFNVEKEITELISSPNIPLNILKLVNDNRPLAVTSFYERIRKNHNEKKSDLYKNIMKETTEVDKILTTLSAFVLQVNLYARYLENNNIQGFFKHSRVEEVTRVLNNYYRTYDLTSCVKILRLIKSDILAFETIRGRRKETD